MQLHIQALMGHAITGNVRAYDNLSFDEARTLREWKQKFIQQHGAGSFWMLAQNAYARCTITQKLCICCVVEFLGKTEKGSEEIPKAT